MNISVLYFINLFDLAGAVNSAPASLEHNISDFDVGKSIRSQSSINAPEVVACKRWHCNCIKAQYYSILRHVTPFPLQLAVIQFTKILFEFHSHMPLISNVNVLIREVGYG